MTTTEARPAATVLQLCLRNGTAAGGTEEKIFALQWIFYTIRFFSPISLTFAADVVHSLSKTCSLAAL